MDTPSAVQAYVALSFVFLIAVAGLIFYLLIGLLIRQTHLRKTQAQLQEYSAGLERLVVARTTQLQASEQKYRVLFESSGEAILVVDRATGGVLNANAEAGSVFGYSPQELEGRSLQELGLTLQEPADGRTWLELMVYHRNGEARRLEGLFGAIRYAEVECWQVICRDVTTRRELEAQLVQSQKLSALGRLAAGVAHELNNPLGIIYNCVYYLKSSAPNPAPKVARHLSILEEQIGRCQKIIRELLTFSRAPQPVLELKQIDPVELLETCLRLLAKEIQSGGVRIVRQLEATPLLLADSARLTQVFFNFLVNAVQAMPQGGTLTLSTRLVSLSGEGESPSSAAAVVISFQDTGIGIAPENLPKIFTPFFTTKPTGQGLGLGLSVSYQIIKQHHGDIKVSSRLGAGTRFDLWLPLEGTHEPELQNPPGR